jgi:hypothetical protein
MGELWQITNDELCTVITDTEQRMRADYSVMLAAIHEAETRGLPKDLGYGGMHHLLKDLLRISAGEATRRIKHAELTRNTRSTSGSEVPAGLPATAEAASAGEISSEHIHVIAKHMQALPEDVQKNPEQRQAVENVLVAQARLSGPRTVDARGYEVRNKINPDGPEPVDKPDKDPHNELHLHTLRDGRVKGKFELDTEAGAWLKAALSPLAKPHPASDGERDLRTVAERHGDALAELVKLAADADGMPTEGGAKPHIAVTVPFETLKTGLGEALLDGAGYLNAAEARRLACDANIIPVVLGGKSEPIDVAVPSYTVPARMRRAIVLRDRGCAFPDCERTAPTCDSHHITPWTDGGETRQSNLVLLCGRHHRLIHNSDWEAAIVNGYPEFTPPAYIDSQRRPRRNTIHKRLK